MRPLRNKLLRRVLALAPLLLSVATAAEVLNVYSHRHYGVDQEINELFTQKTGIEVKVVNAEADQLIERLKSEGANSPADVLITVDAGRMQRARAEGLLQPLKSEILEQATPENLRDADGHWFPYTVRARVILVAADRVKAGEIKDYEDLAKPEWKARLLVRSSSSSYNQSLAASLISAHGEEKATAWAKGVASNLARPPQGGDRDQIKAVAAGLADVCVANTYYFGLLLNSPDAAERAAAAKMRLVFPNQDGRGTHVNISAAGITRHAKNPQNAKAFLEFLVTPEVQQLIAAGSYEYPISMDFTLNPTHQTWGSFKIDTETFAKMGEDQEKTSRLFDAAAWK
ncbi:MAG: Fe(3+) ABC transporter substrate-binding protein [Akkermansiaceae bacterium]